jgi:glycosyltransferase involved in cell wall biosynthesis
MAHPFYDTGGIEIWISEISRKLTRMGFEIITSHLPQFDSFVQKKLYFYFRYKPPKDIDIIHLHEFNCSSLLSKKPVISTYHGSAWARFRLLGWKKSFFSGVLEKIRAKFSDVNVAVSREIQRWIPNSIYIPNGVDIHKFKPGIKGLDIRSDKIKVIWVGRKDAIKGYETIIHLKKFFCVIECWDIPHEKMPIYYNSADVFVLPSLYEGMPLTVLEAMACGIPIVAYNVGGLSDVVFNDVNGYLVELGNFNELLEKIRLAYENKKRLGRNGRKLTEIIFNLDFVSKRYKEIYEKLQS